MSEFFVRRPIVAIVIAILMTLIGGVCILALPIAQYPQIAPPEIQVQTHYTGADALTIEQAVAAPIEQQMSGVDNMNYMYSINAEQRRHSIDRQFRRRDRSEHRSRADADPGVARRNRNCPPT
jgi:HAE1 family hydrophobic/amphiphilic exporter-1